jgi:hypothetical protein
MQMQAMHHPDEAQVHVARPEHVPVSAGGGDAGQINVIRPAMTCLHISSICGHVIQGEGRAIQGAEPALRNAVLPIHTFVPALHVQTWFAGEVTMRCRQRNLHRDDLR